MVQSTKERKSNFEILRILAMFGVIVLHYNSNGVTGAFGVVEDGSANQYLLHFMEALAISSVNLFVLISGYFMCSSMKRNIIKPIKLLVQVIVFKEAGFLISYLLSIISSGGSILTAELFKVMLNGLIPNNYFVVLYIVLYIVSAYINLTLASLDEEKYKKLIAILVMLFSVWVTGVDILEAVTGASYAGLSTVGIDGGQKGYTIVNFVMMYCIGAYLKKNSEKKYSTKKLVLLYAITVVLLTLWSISDVLIGIEIAPIAIEYCNPLVVLSAILLFLLFKQMPIGYNKIINSIAKGSFTVFLGHALFVPYIGIEKYSNANTGVLLLHMILSCMIIYIVCWIMYIIYEAITAPIFKWLEKKIHFPKIDLSQQKN